MENESAKRKKEISKHVHRLIAMNKIEEAEKFLLECMEDGCRNTVVLGNLINIYKIQSGKWEKIEELSREYLKLKPNNSFAKYHLEQSLKVRRKKEKIKRVKERYQEKKKKAAKECIRNFRKKLYDGEILLGDIEKNMNEQLAMITDFQKKVLLAETYSYFNLTQKAAKLLKEASHENGITDKEKNIILQALQLVQSKKRKAITKQQAQWGKLSGDERSEKDWEI